MLLFKEIGQLLQVANDAALLVAVQPHDL
jgi:hypothetical protein